LDESLWRRWENDGGASGEIDRPVEKSKPFNWLIRNVRPGANKWASCESPWGGGQPETLSQQGRARSPLPPGDAHGLQDRGNRRPQEDGRGGDRRRGSGWDVAVRASAGYL